MTSDISLNRMGWKASFGNIELLLRQCGPEEFQIQVGDGTLTLFHPARACDFNTARSRAYEHALAFVHLRGYPSGGEAESVVTLEWEPVELEHLCTPSQEQTCPGQQ
jgi:hypothetical protein